MYATIVRKDYDCEITYSYVLSHGHSVRVVSCLKGVASGALKIFLGTGNEFLVVSCAVGSF